MLEHSDVLVLQEPFYRERNVHRGIALVQNPLVVALQILPFLPHSFSKLFQDLNAILLFYQLVSRYPFSHDYAIHIQQKRYVSPVLDVTDRQECSSSSASPDVPKIFCAIQKFHYVTIIYF
ncbi:hypothetical protein TNCV_3744421 [Trichonephila clavipes]|nr:hypothetical protein TNCV_3744421 [Trichonephila clavipes]